MYATPDLIALMMLERERDIEHRRLARLAACVRDGCSPSTFTRFIRSLRAQPATC